MSDQASNNWLINKEQKIFWVLTLAGLFPIWLTSHFPSVDGPAHLAIVHTWINYAEPSARQFRDFFEIGAPVTPNLFVYLFLYPLMKVMSPFVAEKIFLSFYIISFPAAVRYAVSAIDPKVKAISILSIPLAYNFLLNFGFYNFIFGAVIFSITIGYWYRHRNAPSAVVYFVLAALSLLAFFTHLSSIAMIVIAIALFSGGEALVAMRTTPGTMPRKVTVFARLISKRALLSVIGFLPGLLLVLLYLSQNTEVVPQLAQVAASAQPASATQPDPAIQEFIFRVIRLLFSRVFSTLSTSEVFFGIAFNLVWLLVIAVAVLKRRVLGTKRTDPIFYVFLGFLLFFLFVPFQVQVRWVPDRVHLYFLIAAVLMAASQTALATDRLQRICQTMVLVMVPLIVVSSLAFKSHLYLKLEPLTEEFLGASDFIDPNTNVLALRLKDSEKPEIPRISFVTLVQGGSYFTLTKNAVDVKNVQAHTAVVPVRFRPSKSPHRLWYGNYELTATPPKIDLTSFSRALDANLHYVVLWGPLEVLDTTADGERLAMQLAQFYERLDVPSPSGLLQVYELK